MGKNGDGIKVRWVFSGMKEAGKCWRRAWRKSSSQNVITVNSCPRYRSFLMEIVFVVGSVLVGNFPADCVPVLMQMDFCWNLFGHCFIPLISDHRLFSIFFENSFFSPLPLKKINCKTFVHKACPMKKGHQQFS